MNKIKNYIIGLTLSMLCISHYGEMEFIPCVTDYKINNFMVCYKQGNNPIPRFVFLNCLTDYVYVDESRNF